MTPSPRLVVADTSESEPSLRSAPNLDDYAAAIRAGDTQAFELVYHALAKDLIHFGVGMLGDLPSARDVVADVFIALWERRATWDPSRGVRAYLFTAVRNRATNTLRNTRRHDDIHEALVAGDENPGMSAPPVPMDRSLDVAEQVDTVFRTIAQFPDARRTAMILHWRNDLSIPEIADIMGITQNAVYLHLNRGLRTLKHLLADPSESAR